MGIFTRFKDIVASNMSSMLDKAEDPEKLIKLMIREMEDTLIEIKSSCANAIANQKKVQRLLDDIQEKENFWANKAELAVAKGKDALARQALQEKRRYTQKTEAVEIELTELNMIIEQYRDDICELENKLKSA
ncbi:MAG: phage shock protein A, partial [Desulfobacula sp.]|nr:phage shock protein A [Desulfobacula sp.]